MKKLTLGVIIITLSGCATLRPHPEPWSKTDKLLAAYMIAGHTLDAYTTERHQDYPEEFYEKNQILGKHPKDHEIIAYFSITGAAALVIAHFYPEIRPLLLGTVGTVGLFFGYGNYQLIHDR